MNKSPESSPPQEKIISHESVEDAVEKGELLRDEYAAAVERFMLARGEEEGSSQVEDDMKQVGLASMEANFTLLQDLTVAEVEDGIEESICTVAIPVAILNEDIGTIVSTIEKLKRSQGHSEKPVDVVIWANARFSNDNKGDVEEVASKSYAQLVDGLHELGDEKLRIKTALQLISDDKFSMSQLRSNYMDAIALDSLDKDYGFNHPVMWVDADTTSISKDTIESLAEPLLKNEALFTHADLRFSVDWSPNTLPSEMDDATKAVIVNEMQRRQTKALSNKGNDGGYVEESGLAFSIGVYLNAGGVDKTDPINESAMLIRKATAVREAGFMSEKGIIPASIDDCNGRFIDTVKHVKSARMAVSARRHYEVAKVKGAEGLYDIDASGYGDTLFTDMSPSEENSVPISVSDMKSLYESNAQIGNIRNPPHVRIDENGNTIFATEHDRLIHSRRVRNGKIAHRIIERYFKDGS
jgi:hypothetical protein